MKCRKIVVSLFILLFFCNIVLASSYYKVETVDKLGVKDYEFACWGGPIFTRLTGTPNATVFTTHINPSPMHDVIYSVVWVNGTDPADVTWLYNYTYINSSKPMYDDAGYIFEYIDSEGISRWYAFYENGDTNAYIHYERANDTDPYDASFPKESDFYGRVNLSYDNGSYCGFQYNRTTIWLFRGIRSGYDNPAEDNEIWRMKFFMNNNTYTNWQYMYPKGLRGFDTGENIDGNVFAYWYNDNDNKIYWQNSSDGGETWSGNTEIGTAHDGNPFPIPMSGSNKETNEIFVQWKRTNATVDVYWANWTDPTTYRYAVSYDVITTSHGHDVIPISQKMFLGVVCNDTTPGFPQLGDVYGFVLSSPKRGNIAPVISSPFPANNSINISVRIPYLNFTVSDFENDSLNYTYVALIEGCVQSSGGSGLHNETVSISINETFCHPLLPNTNYTWNVSVTDGHGNWDNETYTFRTNNTPTVTRICVEYTTDMTNVRDTSNAMFVVVGLFIIIGAIGGIVLIAGKYGVI